MIRQLEEEKIALSQRNDDYRYRFKCLATYMEAILRNPQKEIKMAKLQKMRKIFENLHNREDILCHQNKHTF